MTTLCKKRSLRSGVTFDPIVLTPSVQQYFANAKVHDRLLADKERLMAFKRAISDVVKTGDVIMDIGAGTGILSQYAAEAGAKKVYLVEENSNILSEAKQRLAPYSKRADFRFIAKRSTDLPSTYIPEKVDVIISETIGSLGINEGIVDTLVDARRFLKNGGLVIPQQIVVYCAPYRHIYRSLGMKPHVLYNGTELIKLLPNATVVADIDFISVRGIKEANKQSVQVVDESADGFCFWFNSILSRSVTISNSPSGLLTSWGIALLPYKLCRGNTVSISFTHRSHSVGVRTESIGTSHGWRIVQLLALDKDDIIDISLSVRGGIM